MSAIAHHPHRVARAVADARTSLASVANVPVWSMTADETSVVIDQLQTLKAQTAELEARVLAHADRIDVASENGSGSTAAWLAHRTHLERRVAGRAVRIAQSLDAHDLTRTALAAGDLHAEQADVIMRAVDALPDDLDTDLVTQAEAHLIDLARHHDAKALRIAGRRILDVVAPDLADAHEARLLDKEERDAARATYLTLRDDHQGRTHGRFTVDHLTGAMLRKYLAAHVSKRHRAAAGPLDPEPRPTPELLGHALTELVLRYPTSKLPKTGGLNATLVVLMPLDTLLGGLKAAHLDTGAPISPGLARQLACEAGLVPAVLGGDGKVLDLGRTRRLASERQRLVKITDQRGRCIADGCERGIDHVHHLESWAQGGKTDLTNLVGTCAWHHTKFHDGHYTTSTLPTGKVAFHRRT